MILTEHDAAQKWCAFARSSDNFCLASKCMSWRWQPLLADDAFAAAVIKAAAELGDTSPGRTKAAKHVTANRAQYGLPTKPFQGYCGLSGKPEA